MFDGGGNHIDILGASSVVAEDLTRLLPAEYQPFLFSRRHAEGKKHGSGCRCQVSAGSAQGRNDATALSQRLELMLDHTGR
jgi:hypothetical protein